MAEIYVSISHKGGTGRSVSTANIAYQLAWNLNRNVCCVDLDLASPTFPSVLGMRHLASGIDERVMTSKGTHTLLRSPQEAATAQAHLISLWSEERYRRLLDDGFYPGDFNILAGTKDAGDTFTQEPVQMQALETLLNAVSAESDIVFLDVRSGLSHLVAALLDPAFSSLISGWLVFHRWTTQHLAAAANLVESLSTNSVPVYRIKTAVIDATDERYPAKMRNWLQGQARDLETLDKQIETLAPEIGRIPLEPTLMVKERIIHQDEIADSLAFPETVEAYCRVASKILKKMAV